MGMQIAIRSLKRGCGAIVQPTSPLNLGRDNMKIILAMAAGVLALGITGCSTTSTKSHDVADNIHRARTGAGLKTL